ncbi:hypothetical protein BDZ89DRAFT_1071126 [Hymenopellis radicata]|nr:hypothetical protein BDZ89DRAFT_1071126 [Hymenopellis radicata]
MDNSNFYSSWMQSTPQQPQASLLNEPSQQSRHEAHPSSSLDDWAKQPPRTASNGSLGGSTSATTPNAHMTLQELLGSVGAGVDDGQQSSFFQSFSQYNIPNNAPYNNIPYGASWQSSPSNHVPLSSYSSLNGATSTSSQPSQQQQQRIPQHSPPPQHQSPPIIDPALTINGSGSNGIPHYSPPPPTPTYGAQPSPPIQQSNPQSRSQLFSLQQHLSLGNNNNSNPYLYSQSFPQLAQSSLAHASQGQGTLSPQALHTSSPGPMMGVLPSQFYGKPAQSTPPQPSQQLQPQQIRNLLQSQSQLQQPQSQPPPPPQPQGPSPQERKERLLASIRPLLGVNAFTGAGAVNNLILTKIRDCAANHYFRAWLENPTAMDITREWLKAPIGSEDQELVGTVMPLLHILDRFPITLETLKATKLGKIIVKLTKNPPSPAIKDMALNLERKWRNMIDGVTGKEEGDQSRRNARWRLRPDKDACACQESATKPPVVTKKVVATPGNLKDAKSDSSFFSEKKVKKLPKFTKAPPPVSVKKEDTNIALPSSRDPFQEALQSMVGKGLKDSAATPPPASHSTSVAPESGRPSKKKKTVQWAADNELEAVRFIEKAVYDDDPVDGTHSAQSARNMEKGEGAALHRHIFEETVDWSEPIPIEIPVDIEYKERGLESQEKATQEQREESVLGALYLSLAQIPVSPAEASHVLSDAEVDTQVQAMTVGPELEAAFWDPMTPNVNVAELMAQLNGAGRMMGGGGAGGEHNVSPMDAAAALAAAIPQDQLQSLLSQLNPIIGGFGGGDPSWSAPPADYGTGTGTGGGSRGRGRGGGGGGGGHRNSKRKPCSFFQAGRCKFGDQCDFAHEYAS